MRASQCVKVWIDNAIINRLVVARRSFWIGPDQLDQARDPGRPAGGLDRRSCLSNYLSRCTVSSAAATASVARV
jgi:hypothetical protein